jgi:glutathione S-transferase
LRVDIGAGDEAARPAGCRIVKLVIGNKNYSSWSLRPWLLIEHFAIPCDEVRIPLYRPEARAEILRHSPSGHVPVLIDGTTTVWDSLAICEYVAELPAARGAWPADRAQRGLARSIAAEMHSSFGALRNTMHMNVRARDRRVTVTPEVADDIARIQQIWRACRAAPAAAGGPWLLGAFSIADAMFAPVAFRFQTYGVACDGTADAYLQTLLEHPAMRRWAAAAEVESEVVESAEVGR